MTTARARLPRSVLPSVLLAVLLGSGCSDGVGDGTPPRGFVLISLSGLRADALGGDPSDSPFLDSLAERKRGARKIAFVDLY